MVYFLTQPYIKDEMEKNVVGCGFIKTAYTLFGQKHYLYSKYDNKLILHLTSSDRGSIEVQGDGIEELYVKGSESEYYKDISNLVKKIKPLRIVNCDEDDIFPELLEKQNQ